MKKVKSEKILKHFQRKSFGFTLVELIIVITILAILGIIAFISFQNFSKDARDANRIATLKSIEKWLNLYTVKRTHYPPPEGWLILSGSINAWYIWENTSQSIQFNILPTDPKDKTQYIYNTNINHTKYQIWAYLEIKNETLFTLNPFLKTYASNIDYSQRYLYTLGNNVWIIIEKETKKTIQELGNINDEDEYLIIYPNDKIYEEKETILWENLWEAIKNNNENNNSNWNNENVTNNCYLTNNGWIILNNENPSCVLH